jgi:hypothetical protein
MSWHGLHPIDQQRRLHPNRSESCKSAEGTRNQKKLETRNPTFETNLNDQKAKRMSSDKWLNRISAPRHPTLDPRMSISLG